MRIGDEAVEPTRMDHGVGKPTDACTASAKTTHP
eukprot:CAMPEP_0181221590 /NCGR_PEP_ID=MMETSP1096-20121128/29493_1 /TAXON_ID=156174 ORGANISM="Chrysochromulina ericina, Strain CCMP281" /NCGR_SAMPLE_ID=MMETSP1096 /ASSEMBLY_ACC=CAM_ASM_000453 /LENGTH=33 /DNA_ID= /DNA_START= /DNA_END= /DNA_ORIENTATION=